MAMSFESINAPAGHGHSDLVESGDTRPRTSYKSMKKKYRKLRYHFEDQMRESNSLFKEEQKAMDLAKRLQEQNDQLLDLLLDVNQSNRVPPNLRYNIQSPNTPETSAVPALEPDLATYASMDVKSALAAVEEARGELASGQISPRYYSQLESSLIRSINGTKALSDLETTPHTTLESVLPNKLPDDLDGETLIGYLSPRHEDDYLSALDNQLTVLPASQFANHPDDFARLEKQEIERDLQLRNPVSVYNWLRRHQPSIFLQDNETSSEKQATKITSSTKAPKRASIAPKQEEIIDEDGFVIAGVPPDFARSKRKREDEPYRPKGGTSRPTKKKKVSGGGQTGDKTHDRRSW